MKNKLNYLIVASLIFGASGAVGAESPNSSEPFKFFNSSKVQPHQKFGEIGQILDDHEARISDNNARITANETAIGDNFNTLDQRLGPIEDSINGQVISVDCAANPAALKNRILTPNTTYVLTGICDGQIIVGAGLGVINIQGDGIGVHDDGIRLPPGETDGNSIFAAIYAIDGVKLNLTNLLIDVASYNAENDLYIAGIGSYWGANVTLDNVNIVGGDQGIGVYNNGMMQVGANVTVTGFRDSGIAAGRVSIIRVYNPVIITGGSNQEGSNSEAIAAIDGSVVALTNGGTITPASGTDISTAQDTAAAISANRNGTITISHATLNGTVWSGNNGMVELRNVTQSGGNIDAYRNGVIRVRSSNVTGVGTDTIFAGVFSVVRMDDTTIGNALGTGSVETYNYGVIDLRGNTDLGGRNVLCSDHRDVRIRSSVTNLGAVGC